MVSDLHERGLDRGMSRLSSGENSAHAKDSMGMNSRAHWPQANTAVPGRSGMRTGQLSGRKLETATPELDALQSGSLATLYKWPASTHKNSCFRSVGFLKTWLTGQRTDARIF